MSNVLHQYDVVYGPYRTMPTLSWRETLPAEFRDLDLSSPREQRGARMRRVLADILAAFERKPLTSVRVARTDSV